MSYGQIGMKMNRGFRIVNCLRSHGDFLSMVAQWSIYPDSNVEDKNERFFIHERKRLPTRALTYRNGKNVASHSINTIPKIR